MSFSTHGFVESLHRLSPWHYRLLAPINDVTEVFAHGLLFTLRLRLAFGTPPETLHKVCSVATLAKRRSNEPPRTLLGDNGGKLWKVIAALGHTGWHGTHGRQFESDVLRSPIAIGGDHDGEALKRLVQGVERSIGITHFGAPLGSESIGAQFHQLGSPLGHDLCHDIAQQGCFARAWWAIHRKQPRIGCEVQKRRVDRHLLAECKGMV